MIRLFLFTLSLFICLSVFKPVSGQDTPDPGIPQGENLQVPEGWMVRTDHGDSSPVISANQDSADIYFVNMTPGWHITTGPAAIYYHPGLTAAGDYSAYTTLHLFDPKGRNREGYGMFVGGRDLDGDAQQYLYFLLRNTGEYLIKTRSGEETEVVKSWTADDAILVFEEGSSESSVKNMIRVQAAGDEMAFYINGTEVHRMSGEGFNTDGMFGLRVNHSVNLHVSDLGSGK